MISIFIKLLKKLLKKKNNKLIDEFKEHLIS